jgi:hypothetical protein
MSSSQFHSIDSMDKAIPQSLFNEVIFNSLICMSRSLIGRQCVSLFLFVWLYWGLCAGLAWLGDWGSSADPMFDRFSHKRLECPVRRYRLWSAYSRTDANRLGSAIRDGQFDQLLRIGLNRRSSLLGAVSGPFGQASLTEPTVRTGGMTAIIHGRLLPPDGALYSESAMPLVI